MSEGFEASEYVARPVEIVWSCLTDWRRAPEWMRGIDSMHAAEAGAVGEGSRLVFRARGVERDSEIVAWQPPRRLVLRSRQGGMTATYEYTCTPEGDGTRVKLHARCQASGLGWHLVSPLIQFLMKHSDRGQVAALRRVLEAEPTARTPE